MKTLQVDGRELSLEEVEAIVREHFSKKEEAKTILKPMEGIPFEVKPLSINWDLFATERTAVNQENARRLILMAYDQVKKYPEKYAQPFKTIMPIKVWDYASMWFLTRVAEHMGGDVTDMVEWALQLAQRLHNGETWDDVCEKPDTANWYRVVKEKSYYFVGGSRKLKHTFPASRLGCAYYGYNGELNYAVPLVTLRDEN